MSLCSHISLFGRFLFSRVLTKIEYVDPPHRTSTAPSQPLHGPSPPLRPELGRVMLRSFATTFTAPSQPFHGSFTALSRHLHSPSHKLCTLPRACSATPSHDLRSRALHGPHSRAFHGRFTSLHSHPHPVCRSLRYNGNIDGDAKQLLRSSARDGLELLLD